MKVRLDLDALQQLFSDAMAGRFEHELKDIGLKPSCSCGAGFVGRWLEHSHTPVVLYVCSQCGKPGNAL